MKILVGYDGSDASKKALMIAKQHADILRGRIEVACAVSRKEPLTYPKIQNAEQQLARQVENILHSKRISFETTLLVGVENPAKQIINFAQSINADEIIIGSKKRSKIGKFVLGSTTQSVVLNAPCPVIVAK